MLTRPLHMVFGTDEPFEGALETTCREFCDRTRDYWLEWVRRLAFSFDWQDEIIRAGITLKLCNFEETGAIVAALTTSIPEGRDRGATGIIAICWMRDAFFVVRALNRIGATRTMEDFISYILSIAAGRADGLRPLYGIVHTDALDERIAPSARRLSRRRAGAHRQCRGRIRTSTTSMAASSWRRRRCSSTAGCRSRATRRCSRCSSRSASRRRGSRSSRTPASGNTAAASACTPIRRRCAGPAASGWRRSRTISVWPSARTIGARIANRIGEQVLQARLESEAQGVRRRHSAATISTPACLLLAELGLIAPDDPRFVSTVEAIERELRRDFNVMRYVAADDFGLPETAFLICRFWLIDAMWEIGRREEARDMFVDALRLRNRYGLLSEDVHPVTGKLWGNFPQTYSMAGLILTAIKLSRSWGDRYWRGSS